jgi:TatD DNase family protein
MLIDTHCHLASRQFSQDDRNELINKAVVAGVGRMITLGTTPTDWLPSIQWSEDFTDIVSTCLGLHPMDVTEAGEGWQKQLTKLVKFHTVVAIGETGLDYYYPAPEGWSEDKYRATQREALEFHYDLANQLGLNIVLHTRDKVGSQAFEDAVAIARQYSGRVKPVFHCFIGNKDQARLIFDELDGMVSFTGVVTFKNAGELPEVVQWCPAERVMMETDSPYLSPVPLRGKRNDPSHLVHTAQFIAELRKMDLEMWADQCTNNAQRFFSL